MPELHGSWKIAADSQNIGRTEAWFTTPRPEALDIPVPGELHMVFPDQFGVFWYWCRFDSSSPLPAAVPGQRVLLRFGAVDYFAEVWLNGIFLGAHEGGETGFEFNATAALMPGAENLLAVRVINPGNERVDGFLLAEIPHRNKAVPMNPGSSYNYGGILLPVELVSVPALRISDEFVEPDPATGAVQVHLTVRNDTGTTQPVELGAFLGPSRSDEISAAANLAVDCPAGESTHTVALKIPQPHPWNLDDPFLYRADAVLRGDGVEHNYHVRFGFRDFRIENGWFKLNGKRLFLKSTHTGNHFPIGWVAPVLPDFMRRDLVYAKALGFNCVRFIAGVAWPEQLDLCDELGLMVYEEHLAGWCLSDSPKMKERYDRATRDMILRDRNHPSIIIWGLLNETFDGPVFRHAVEALQLVRELDPTRLVLLGSGRWDCHPDIGSASNPGSTTWEHVWGVEAPDAPPVSSQWHSIAGGYFDRAGDAHAYPSVPQTAQVNAFIRSLGQDTKPVFLSEYGIGSLMNVIDETRKYAETALAEPGGYPAERFSAPPDAALIRFMADRLEADWQRYRFVGVYPFAEDMLRDSQRLHARQRRLGFDLIRSNPQLCGYNLTGMLDHGITGEGLWSFWRELKPGIADALRDGWAPLRWCLFVTPLHGYAGRPVTIEAVLANEDVLPPGEYPVTFRVSGPEGIVWERSAILQIPKPAPGTDPALAVPVLKEEIVLNGPAGSYELAARLEQGGCPAGDRLRFLLSAPVLQPPRPTNTSVAVWGLAPAVVGWLQDHDIRCVAFDAAQPTPRAEVILVGELQTVIREQWLSLLRCVARGSVAVFLTPKVFRRGEDSTFWLPLAKKGVCKIFNDWLYHKDCVAKRHPVFAGLQAGGVMDWDYYDQVISHDLFEGQDTPDEVIVAAFAAGYSCPGGYESGVMLGSYQFGAGRLVLNTLNLLEQLDQHPAADRLVLNLIAHAQSLAARRLQKAPEEFLEQVAGWFPVASKE